MAKTIEERAEEYTESDFLVSISHSSTIENISNNAYIAGATDQRKIDIDKACEWLKDMLALQRATPDFVEEALERFRQAMEKE